MPHESVSAGLSYSLFHHIVEQEGTDDSDKMHAIAMGKDGSVVLAGSTDGNWNAHPSDGTHDFAAVKLDVDGNVLWRWRVNKNPHNTHVLSLMNFCVAALPRACETSNNKFQIMRALMSIRLEYSPAHCEIVRQITTRMMGGIFWNEVFPISFSSVYCLDRNLVSSQGWRNPRYRY